jgi:hypothetical protein
MILSCLMALYARDGAKPRREGLAPGHRRSKPRQRLEGYCILYADYITDDTLHDKVVFRCRFQDESEALHRHCLSRSVIQKLLHMQEGLYWYG